MNCTGGPRGVASLSPSRGIPGFPITHPTVGDLWENLKSTRALLCCEDLIFSLVEHRCDDYEEHQDGGHIAGDNAVVFLREHIKHYGGGDEASDAFFAFLSAFKSNNGEEPEYTSSIAKSIRREQENRELRAQVVSLEQQLACREAPAAKGKRLRTKKGGAEKVEKKVAKKHGLPHGGIDAPGSFWADKNDCITCVGGGVRKSFVGVPIGEMCPNALLMEEDPQTGVKLLICQCQVKSE
jgi:hypothetical protein